MSLRKKNGIPERGCAAVSGQRKDCVDNMGKTLYCGGSVITMISPAVHEALVEEDGVIRGVGRLADMRALAGADARVVDLQGGALLPAFIDPHSHIVQLADSMRFVSLAGCRCFEDIAQALTEFQKKNSVPAGRFLIGFGYDHTLLAEKQHPAKELLDKAAPAHPVLISHASGHMGCANSAALRLAGIDASTPDPEGGVIGRLPDSREPSGYLEENAFIQLSALVPPADEEEMLRLLEKAQQVYASCGITTVQEGYMRDRELPLLCRAAEDGRLFLDTVGYIDIKEHAGQMQQYGGRWKDYHGHFRIGGYKLFLDGSPQGRTAWMTSPYAPQEGQPSNYRGYPIYSDAQVRAFVQQAGREHRQLLTHCNGDAAIDQLLAAHERPSRERNVIIHAQLMRPDQLPRVRQLSLIPSYFVAHVYHWGDVHWQNFGPQRAETISPVASTKRLGIPFTLHQDTPVLPPDMLGTVSCAVRRMTRQGRLLGKDERVDVYTALQGVTAYAAYQYHEERCKGTLQTGKTADMVILSRSPLEMPDELPPDIRIRSTIKAGREIYSAGD